MPTRPSSPTPAHLVRRARQRIVRGQGDEGGFILLETMIALTLITVIMAAVSLEYVNGMVVSAQQRSTATAAQVATSAMSDLRGVDATDLITGRSKDAVITQRTRLNDIQKVAPWISLQADRLVYSNATATASVPTTRTEVRTPTKTFGVEKYLECNDESTVVNAGTATELATCGASDTRSALRAVVVVVWSSPGCQEIGTAKTPTCAFVSSTLIDAHTNPTFDLNQPLPAAPVVTDPGDQVLAIEDVVSTQLLVQDGKGAAPFTWSLTSGSLPTGLSLSPAGLISGTVGGTRTTTPITTTIRVTDAFLRTADVTIKWTVNAKLTIGTVGPQTSTVNRAATPVTATATGGSGSYTYSATGLPAGISINAGTGAMSGTPTTANASAATVVVTATDSGGRKVTTSFTWKVDFAPLTVTDPGTRTVGKDRALSIQVVASGGSGSSSNYTYAASAALPNGLTLSSTGLISGAPTSTGTPSIEVTVTDTVARTSAKGTLKLNVVDAPVITAPGDQKSSKLAKPTVRAAATCATTCTFAATGLPEGLSMNSAGVVSGTVATSAQPSNSVRVTATDAAGIASTVTITWQVVAPATVTLGSIGDLSPGSVANSPIAYTCENTPCTLTATGLPAGLGLSNSPVNDADLSSIATRTLDVTGSSGTVYLTGKVGASATGTGQNDDDPFTAKIVVADKDGQGGDSSQAFDVWRRPSATSTSRNTVAAGSSTSTAVSYSCANGYTAFLNIPYSVTCRLEVSGAPAGVTLSSTSVSSGTGSLSLSGRVTAGQSGQFPIKISIVQSSGGNTPARTTESWVLWTVTR